MAVEVVPLQLDRGVVPVAVQSGLAQGDHAGMVQQANDCVPVARTCLRAAIGVNADRRIDARIGLGQSDGCAAGCDRRAQGDHALDARSGRAGHDRRAIGRKLLVVKMAVGVDHGEPGAGSGKKKSEIRNPKSETNSNKGNKENPKAPNEESA